MEGDFKYISVKMSRFNQDVTTVIFCNIETDFH